jgi:DNA-binding IscR family transcriptional regulator
VIRAIDGPIILTSCFTEHSECNHSDRCSVREPLRKVHEGILRLLESITIFDICRDDMEVNVEAVCGTPALPPLLELKPAMSLNIARVETA